LPTKKRPGSAARRPLAPIGVVTAVLEEYAARGVFRGFHAAPPVADKASFRMMWHYDRQYEVNLDAPGATLTVAGLLPGVPTGSSMYNGFRSFLKDLQSPRLPEHRRIDRKRAVLRCSNRGGAVSLRLIVHDGDFEYGARKLIHAVHEIFLCFLADGPYTEYLTEHFGLDPDKY
jgi:hypothetical protein